MVTNLSWLPVASRVDAERRRQPAAARDRMGDKYSGGLAGGGVQSEGAELGDAVASASLHETLVPGEGSPLRVIVNRHHGGVALLPCDPLAAARRAIVASQMRSMLADSARCAKYSAAIDTAVKQMLQQRNASADVTGDGVRVVDIGAGTGLLGMLAARAGAVQTDAVEMFAPMADVASKIVVQNGLANHCVVYGGYKSTDMSVKDDERYHIVVSEIVDSALLGEGILPVLAHARENLLTKDAISVPASARVYGQLVESPHLFALWHNLSPGEGSDVNGGTCGEENRGFPFFRSEAARGCNGGSRVFPVHLDALSEGDYTAMSDAFPLFDFDFLHSTPMQKQNKVLEVRATLTGIPHAVILWWELDLTGDGSLVYSTQVGAENWQDHWLQGVFPLPCAPSAPVEAGAVVPLHVGHTDSEMYFSLSRARSPRLCSCGFHNLRGSGPARIAALGDRARRSSLRKRTAAAVTACRKRSIDATGRAEANCASIRVLDVSTASSIAGLLAAEAGSAACQVDVTSLETEDEEDSMECLLYRQVATAMARERRSRNGNSSHANEDADNSDAPPNFAFTMVYSIDDLQQQPSSDDFVFDVMVAEPYHPAMTSYSTAVAASLWLRRAALATLLSASIRTVPARCSIRAQALSFAPNTLQNNFAVAGSVLGLDHTALDAVVAAERNASGLGYELVSLPLYMYAHTELSVATELYLLAFADMPPEGLDAVKTQLSITTGGQMEAIAVWAEYDGERLGHTEHIEILWLDERQPVWKGDNVEVECRWDRQGLGGFGFSIAPQVKQ